MTETPESEIRQPTVRNYLSKPPLRLVVSIVAISVLMAGAGTILVLAQNSGQTTPAGENATSGDKPVKTIAVGPGDEYVFEPGTEDSLRIEPGTTVKFVWKSDNHNLVVGNQPTRANWTGHEKLESEGYSTRHTFEVNGSYTFYSQPYRSVGMVGEIIVGASETPDDQPVTTGSPNVTVGPNGNFTFKPSGDDPLVVKSGTTVTFNWESGNHNIVVGDQPEGANWTGTAGGASTLYDATHTYTHTFAETGVYEFYCEPHQSVGMTGTIVVVDDNSSEQGA